MVDLKTVDTCKECRQPIAKIHADSGIIVKIGEIIDELTELIRKDATEDALADFIDEQFLFGAWSEVSNVAPRLFLKNVRGLIVDACRKRISDLEKECRV